MEKLEKNKFYWVLKNKLDEWEVAQYLGNDDLIICGDENTHSPDEFDKINKCSINFFRGTPLIRSIIGNKS